MSAPPRRCSRSAASRCWPSCTPWRAGDGRRYELPAPPHRGDRADPGLRTAGVLAAVDLTEVDAGRLRAPGRAGVPAEPVGVHRRPAPGHRPCRREHSGRGGRHARGVQGAGAARRVRPGPVGLDARSRRARAAASAADGAADLDRDPAVPGTRPERSARRLPGTHPRRHGAAPALRGPAAAPVPAGGAREVEEAAAMDGASAVAVFLRIVVPIARHGAMTVASLLFVISSGEFLYAISFLSDPAKYPLSATLAQQVGQYGIDWPALMAVSVLASGPAIVIFAAGPRSVVRRLSAAGGD